MENANSNTTTTFDRKEAARRLGISVVTLDRLIARKKMPHFRVGRRILFQQLHLDHFVQSNSRGMKF